MLISFQDIKKMLPQIFFLPRPGFSLFLLMLLCFGMPLQAQDLQPKLQSVKVVEEGKFTEGFYLFETDNYKRASHFNTEDVVKRYSDRFFVIKWNGSAPDRHIESGTFYEISNEWKLSAELRQNIPKGTNLYSIRTTNKDRFIAQGEFQILNRYGDFLVIKASSEDLSKLLDHELITHIGIYRRPTPEAPVGFHDLSVNGVNLVHRNFPEIEGEGLKASVKEQLFDTTDIDIRNRYILTGVEGEKVDQHATLIATLIAGAGNSGGKARGVARGAEVTSSSFLNLFPHPPDFYASNQIYVENHSYGTSPEQEYGNEAAAYDQNVNELPEMVHVFSSGNMGEYAPVAGVYEGIKGFANLTGNFKMAKNIFTVGAVDKNKQVLERSSKGPAYDGRLKPEFVAYAQAGTSDAAAIVSGTVLLLQELYLRQEGVLPDAALLKAVLMAGAEDVGQEHIDFSSGYGNVQAHNSMKIIDAGQYFSGELEPDGTVEFQIEVPKSTAELKVALSWNDPAANPGDASALIHDLELRLQDPSGIEWLPWTLDHSPREESLLKLATRGRDSLNPAELITIEDPKSGIFSIKISAEDLVEVQDFALAYSIIPKDDFAWTFPTSEDALLLSEENILRWTESFSKAKARLEYQINGGEWNALAEEIDPDINHLKWEPQEPGQVRLRAVIGEESFESEVFAVAPELVPEVLYNCDSEFMISWEEVAGADAYKVLALGEKYMEKVYELEETAVVVDRSLFGSRYWSVIPVFGDVEGVQGRAIDVPGQGVLCHYRNFFALLEEKEGVKATLNLSNSPLVTGVRFIKVNGGIPTEIGAFSAPFSAGGIVVEDKELLPGNNFYSAVISLQDGQQIETEPVKIFIPGEKTFQVYPNPVSAGEDLNIISKGDDLQFYIYDISGKRIVKDELIHYSDRIEIRINTRGLYIVNAVRAGRSVGSAKVLVE